MDILDLKRYDGRKFYYDKNKLKPLKDEIEDFVENEPLIKSYKFEKSSMPQEIKSNNGIEGLKDDIDDITSVIFRKLYSNRVTETNRILNVYKAYKYILNNKGNDIDKERLKELYSIISKDLLCEYDLTNMGEYYRTKDVCVTNKSYFDDDNLCLDPSKIEEYMNILFDYIKNNKNNNRKIDTFIESQIIHFYFVYIHPYFDCNGRTSRTIAMWHLLNDDAYSYLNFNRAISSNKSEYSRKIYSSKEVGNLEYFLKFMLNQEQLELEKEYVINNIIKNIGISLNDDEYLLLEYLLSLGQEATLFDLIKIYNSYNDKKKLITVLNEKIKPLIDKQIILLNGKTNKSIKGISNYRILLNRDLIDVNQDKIHKLELSRFVKR